MEVTVYVHCLKVPKYYCCFYTVHKLRTYLFDTHTDFPSLGQSVRHP